MRRVTLLSIAGAFALVSAAADAQTPMRIRGTITSVEGDVLSVKTRDGKISRSISPRISRWLPPRGSLSPTSSRALM